MIDIDAAIAKLAGTNDYGKRVEDTIAYLNKMKEISSVAVKFMENQLGNKKMDKEKFLNEIKKLDGILANMRQNGHVISLSEYKNVKKELSTLHYELNSLNVMIQTLIKELTSASSDFNSYREQIKALEEKLENEVGKIYQLTKN